MNGLEKEISVEQAVSAENVVSLKEKRAGLPGSTLKLIAMVCMLIDHSAVLLIEQELLGVYSVSGAFPLLGEGWMVFDIVLRAIGRVAFPIFCFLLVEGFFTTHSRGRYVGRMALFCLLSEIPFDLAMSDRLFYNGYQSVYFTLCVGLLVLWGADWVQGRTWNRFLRAAGVIGVLLAGMVLADWLKTDYGSFGVLFIFLFYALRTRREWLRNLVCGAACAWEVTAPLALVPIHFYNGQRGLRLKYVFYLFYPGHLLLLKLLQVLIYGT